MRMFMISFIFCRSY